MASFLLSRRALRLPPSANPQSSWRITRQRSNSSRPAGAVTAQALSSTFRASRYPSRTAMRSISTSPRLLYADSSWNHPTPSATVDEKDVHERLYILHGTTAVLPPLRKVLTNPNRLSYIYQLARFKFYNLFGHLTHLWSSKEQLFPRPKFKYRPQLSKTPGIARDLHARVNQAIAAGDTRKLSDLCTPALADKYNRAIQLRAQREAAECANLHSGVNLRHNPRHQILVWEPLRYTSPPKLVDRTSYVIPANLAERVYPASVRMPIISQAVVRIASVQRLARWRLTGVVSSGRAPPHPSIDRTGWEIVPGTEKVHAVTENVVIMRHHDPKTYEPLGEWRMWGTIAPLSWDRIKETLRMDKDHNEKMDREARQLLGLKAAAKSAAAASPTRLGGGLSSPGKKRRK